MNMRDKPDAKRQKLAVEPYSYINDLPDELVIEILCRLPDNKYVFQCKCISKHWLSLISSPDFIRRFVSVANNKMKIKEPVMQPWAFVYFKSMVESLYKAYPFPPSYKADRKEASTVLDLLSLYPDTFKSNEFSLEFLPCYRGGDDQPVITIVKTYNDLILCCEEKFDKSESCAYYICNPRTKQWMALPPTPPHDRYTCTDVEFICEPYYYTDEKGMVILNTEFKFKVFRFLDFSASKRIRLQIFSSETGKWDMTLISMPPRSHLSYIVRSFLCKDRVTLAYLTRWHPDFTLRVIMLDHHPNQCLHRVVYFPGSVVCRNRFHSIMHLSLREGSFHVVQIFMNFVASQPNYGVPFLYIWRLDESVTKWDLWHAVSFRHMTSPNKWISDVYLKGTFVGKENGKYRCNTPIVLGFHPYNANLLYLNLNCEGDDNQMGLYDVKNRTLSFASEYCQWHHSSFPRYTIYRRYNLWSAVSQIVLPSWPTPIPQISVSQSQEAA